MRDLQLHSTPVGVFIIKDNKLYRLTVKKVFKDQKEQNEWSWENIQLPKNGESEASKGI